MESVNEENGNVNEVTLAAMDAAERDTNMHGPFDSVETLMEALNA